MHAKGDADSESGRFVTGVKCCRVAHSIQFTKTLCVFLLLKSQDCNPNVNNYPCFKNRNNTFQLVSISFHNHAVIITNLYVVVTHPQIGNQVEVCEETVSILARCLSPLAYRFCIEWRNVAYCSIRGIVNERSNLEVSRVDSDHTDHAGMTTSQI